ncbi:hypothetical protein NLU13_6579 [Sarocladium strictum]|uniref:DUF6604 domain-containing protein n=1 Tax=Sarocladium strictum TaxID=5046 RepID=A0AA39GHG1_SARSR|nr:hypothetical protein NLU13_6579 [Sarocladium strictum]
MLPSHLIGTYRQYKQDTDSVASWLASTAKSCGYPADLLANSALTPEAKQAPKSGRLKGKARKEARSSGAPKTVPQPETTSGKSAKYIIAIKDFLPLADFIAGRRNPPVSVPDVFAATIDRLIALRSSFGGRLTDSGAKLDPKADETHGYFLGVLEAVRKALRPGMTDAAKGDADDATHSLGGRFAGLSVEEPSQAFLDFVRDSHHERPKPRDEDPASYEAEPQTSLEDVIFAFIALANDLMKMRSRIKWIWSNHRDGMFDLAAAAVATNTAISMARGLIDDVAPLLATQKGGAGAVLTKFYFAMCLQKGFKDEQLTVKNSKDNFNYDTYEVADECYFVAFRILSSFIDVLQPTQLPLIREGMFGKYEPETDRASKTGRQKFLEDQILLMEFFTELITVIRLIPGYPVEDEFLREMRTFEKTSTVSFSLIFAAQVFLDIHHTMRAVVRDSVKAMFKETNEMTNLLARHLDFHKNLKVETWPASNDQALRELSQQIKWMGQDPVHGAKAKVYTRLRMPVPSEMEVHRILIYSPVLTGLWLFLNRAKMYEIGITVANAWGSITYSAHLYNAVQSLRLIEDRWADMDVVLTMLGDLNIWVGGERPKSPGDWFRKFCLQMGVSAAGFTSNRRRKTAVASRAGPRGIKDGIPVSSIFKDPVTKRADMKWTPELLDDIVARSTFEVDGSAENGDFIMSQIDDPKELREKDRLREKRAKARDAGKDKAAAELIPEKLIESLTLALNSESLEMAFPWLLMHRWCWKLLGAVRDHCDSALRERYTFAYMEKECELPWVVGYILMAASGIQGPPDLKLLQLAGEACQEMISSGSGRIAITICELIGKSIEFREEMPAGA